MTKYEVVVLGPEGQFETRIVEAHHYDIIGGALLFEDPRDFLVQGFGPSMWVEVKYA